MEFQDALSLRYNWSIKRIPKKCECGIENDLDHLLTFKNGGYIIMRHNDLRDAESNLLSEAGCQDVRVKPLQIPTRGDHLQAQKSKDIRQDWTLLQPELYESRAPEEKDV